MLHQWVPEWQGGRALLRPAPLALNNPLGGERPGALALRSASASASVMLGEMAGQSLGLLLSINMVGQGGITAAIPASVHAFPSSFLPFFPSFLLSFFPSLIHFLVPGWNPEPCTC